MKTGWKVVIIILAVIVALIIILSIVGANANKKTSNVDIDVAVPTVVTTGDSFDIVVTIDNLIEKEQELHGIGVSHDLFEFARLVDVSESTSDQYDAFGMRTYEFKMPLEAMTSTTVTMEMEAGSMPGFTEVSFDVCVNGIGSCVRNFVSLEVE